MTTKAYISSTSTTTTPAQKSTTSAVSTSTEDAFKFYLSRKTNTEKTPKPFERQTEKTKSFATYSPTLNRYSITSTKNPYDFKDFTTLPPKTEKTTKRGFYSKDEIDNYFGRATTKAYPDKGVKPIFKIGTYYSQAKSSDNSIRPDANSQQVQIEPARMVLAYQRNLTTGQVVQL